MIVRIVSAEAKSLGVDIHAHGFKGNQLQQIMRVANAAKDRIWYWNNYQTYFDPYVRVRSEQLFQVGQYGMGKGSDLVHQHQLGWRTGLFKDTTHKTKEGQAEQARIKKTPRYSQLRDSCLQKLDRLVVDLGLEIEAPEVPFFQQILANPDLIATQENTATDNSAGEEDSRWSDTTSDPS